MGQVSTNRADLIGLLRLGKDLTDIAMLAELTGFEALTIRVESRTDTGVSLSLDDQPFEAHNDKLTQETIPAANAAQSARSAWFWQPVSREPVSSGIEENDLPLWWTKALPVGQRHNEQKSVSQPSEVSLVHWPRLGAFLRHQCMDLRNSSAPDEMRLVGIIASAQNLKRIPKKSFRRWAHRVVLVRDHAAELLPVQGDFRVLEKRLFELLGTKLKLIAVDENDLAEAAFDRFMEHAGLSPEEVAQASWLILSDLGSAVTQSPRPAFWQSFLTWLRDVPVRALPLVLMPTSENPGFPGLNGLARTVVWDITRPLRVAQVLDNAPSRCDVTALLAMLSMATEARPRLLRKLRLLLSEQSYDIGSELAVWNHAHVLRCAPVCFIHPKLRRDYQKIFQDQSAGDPAKIQETIESDHSNAWPCVRDPEIQFFSAMGEQPDQNPDYIGDVIFTLVKHPQSPDHALRLRWAKQLIEETERNIVNSNEKLAALNEVLSITEAAQGGSGIAGDRRFDFLTRDLPAKTYHLIQTGSELRWVQESSVRGSPIVRNASCKPFVKVTHDVKGIGKYQSVDCAIPAISERLNIVTTDARIELQRAHRPEWASAMGRDERGLFAILRQDRRRLEWCEPGFVILKEKGGPKMARWMFERGFWHDVATGGADGVELTRPDWAAEFGVDSVGVYTGFEVEGVVQKMRWLMPGMFKMGSPASEHDRRDNETQHDVILSQDYWLADTACTQALWKAVMGKNPSAFKGKDRPVEQVSWDDVQEFLVGLNLRVPGLNAALPSEAQWEYACRAGTTSPFSFGETVNTGQANFDWSYPYRDQDPKSAYRGNTVDVKALPQNAWGLYQMHGNIWQWCRDGLREYESASVVDPLGPEDGGPRVVRGGSWVNYAGHLRYAFRIHRRRAEPPRSRAEKLHEPDKGWTERLRDRFSSGKDVSDTEDEP